LSDIFCLDIFCHGTQRKHQSRKRGIKEEIVQTGKKVSRKGSQVGIKDLERKENKSKNENKKEARRKATKKQNRMPLLIIQGNQDGGKDGGKEGRGRGRKKNRFGYHVETKSKRRNPALIGTQRSRKARVAAIVLHKGFTFV